MKLNQKKSNKQYKSTDQHIQPNETQHNLTIYSQFNVFLVYYCAFSYGIQIHLKNAQKFQRISSWVQIFCFLFAKIIPKSRKKR